MPQPYQKLKPFNAYHAIPQEEIDEN